VAEDITLSSQYQAAGSVNFAYTNAQISALPVAVGDVYQVSITGSLAADATELVFALTTADGDYCEKSDYGVIAGPFTAGVEFSKNVLVTVKENTCTSAPRLSITAKSSAFTTTPITTVVLTATIDVTKKTTPSGTVLNDNGNGINQRNFTEELPEAFAIGDKFNVTITGTASADVSLFQVVAVDENDNVANWSEMSDYTDLTGTITAGTPFSITGVLEITKNVPATINERARTLVLMATSGEEMLGIENLVISVTPYTGPVVEAAELTPTTLILANAYQGVGEVQAKGGLSQFNVTAEKGAEYEITIQGTNASAYDLTGIECVIVDDTETAGFWAELSNFGVFETAIAAGASIDEKVTVTIKDADFPAAATLGNAKLAVNGKSDDAAFTDQTDNATSTVSVAFSDVTISVVKKTGTAIATVGTAKITVKSSAIEISSEKAIASVVVTNVIGAQVINQAVGAQSASVSTAALQAGIYYATINFANVKAQVVKFVK
jgi:hypothetical protein